MGQVLSCLCEFLNETVVLSETEGLNVPLVDLFLHQIDLDVELCLLCLPSLGIFFQVCCDLLIQSIIFGLSGFLALESSIFAAQLLVCLRQRQKETVLLLAEFQEVSAHLVDLFFHLGDLLLVLTLHLALNLLPQYLVGLV